MAGQIVLAEQASNPAAPSASQVSIFGKTTDQTYVMYSDGIARRVVTEDGNGDASITRNLSVAGTTTSTGDFTVGASKFTVTAASGNTVVAGTLDVTGATSLRSTVRMNTTSTVFSSGEVASILNTATGAATNTGLGIKISEPTAAGLALWNAGTNPLYTQYADGSGGVTRFKFGYDGINVYHLSQGGTTGQSFQTPGGEQVRINNTASATRYITLTGSNGGNPTIGTSAGDLAVSSALSVTATSGAGGVGGAVGLFQYDGTHRVKIGSDGTTGIIGTVDSIAMLVDVGNAEIARFTAGGYFKASNTGSYAGTGTSAWHEFNTNGDNRILSVVNTAASLTGIASGLYINFSAVAPNGTSQNFIYAEDNAALRFSVRSNGGIANFSANNVNLSALSVKKDFQVIWEVPGLADKMWAAHRDLDYGRYKYKDQTHDDYNYGPSADKINELFTSQGIVLTDKWTPERQFTNRKVVIDGVNHLYSGSEDNPDSPLGITGDFQYVTAAMVAYAQRRIERLEAGLTKAGILF